MFRLQILLLGSVLLPGSVVAAEAANAETEGDTRQNVVSDVDNTVADAPPGDVEGGLRLFRHLSVRALLQGQYERNDLSEDQFDQGGATRNRDRFVVRRARVRLGFNKGIAIGEIEVNGSTDRNAGLSLRLANVGVRVRPDPVHHEPLFRTRVGISEIPFGWEVPTGQIEAQYFERSRASSALFPGQTDIGLRIDGRVGPFVYDTAITNGNPISDTPGTSTADPTQAPDVVFRFGATGHVADVLTLSGGISGLTGTGIHRGTDAEKPRVEWRDLNENDSLDTGELIAVPGRGATPSYTYHRWAAGIDVQLELSLGISNTRLTAEAVVAANLDRGLIIADPIATGADIRHLGWNAGIVQTLYDRVIIAFRYDVYDPDSDFLDERQGYRVPQDARIHTWTPMVGVDIVPELRLAAQYEFVRDRLGRDTSGVPVDLQNNRFLVRLQGTF